MHKHVNLSAPGRPPYAMQAIISCRRLAIRVKALASTTPGARYEPAGDRIVLPGPTLEDARHAAKRKWREGCGRDGAEGYWIANSDGEIVDIVTER